MKTRYEARVITITKKSRSGVIHETPVRNKKFSNIPRDFMHIGKSMTTGRSQAMELTAYNEKDNGNCRKKTRGRKSLVKLPMNKKINSVIRDFNLGIISDKNLEKYFHFDGVKHRLRKQFISNLLVNIWLDNKKGGFKPPNLLHANQNLSIKIIEYRFDSFQGQI